VKQRSSSLRLALVFPGQGSQAVGMGRDLFEQVPEAREVFTLADRAVRFPLSELIFEGPAQLLQQTINAQPAIATVSIAALAALQARLPAPLTPLCAAGHSLGEYTALVPAGALAWTDAIALIAVRARLMQRASEQQPGGMAAVLGLDEAAVAEVCRQVRAEVPGSFVTIANINSPGQIVIAGDHPGLARAQELASALGARRVISLPVSGAFHSQAMRSIADRLAERIRAATIRPAEIPIIGNVSAAPLTEPDEIRRELAEQVYSPVRWADCVRTMLAAGVQTFIELGPGQVLAGLIRRIDPSVEVLNVGNAAEAARVAAKLAPRLAR
jgi:[acyl-carrier-protein] S-malonyltransferase